ncbi:MAG: hypothetical protein A2Z18_07160 [Armatimonadetes bacterium RBG_16_58_9]|nr:MAG: hypothetical protein A2Z18_07160 [Armatimonadetes bacterium RBG_16_58_9]
MCKVATLLLVATFVLSATAAIRADEEMGMMDRTELSLSAAWVDVADITAMMFAAHYGKYLTPNLAVQLGALYANLDEGGSEVTGWALAPEVAYHFISETTTTTVPYVGVGWYFFNVDDLDVDDNGLEAFVGAKFFMNGDYQTSNHAFFVEYRYLNDVAGENVNSVLIGITNFF